MQPGSRTRRVDDAVLPAESAEPAERTEDAEGGETACWAHLVCPECGAMVSEGHTAGCSSGPAASTGR